MKANLNILASPLHPALAAGPGASAGMQREASGAALRVAAGVSASLSSSLGAVHAPPLVLAPRRPPVAPTAAGQRTLALSLGFCAWLLLLLGLAHLVMAVMHDRAEELGLSMDALRKGFWACLGGVALAAVALPLWLRAAPRRPR